MLPFKLLLGLSACVCGQLLSPVSAPRPVPIPTTASPFHSRRLPNELGRIPILMYHSVGGHAEFAGGPRYDRHGLNIAPDTLRRQIAVMEAAGWYPANVRDVLSARLSVPCGKTPVVLTFDDACPSQFRYLSDGRIDPDCAVGILEAFHRTHPAWPRRATFYVLPESSSQLAGPLSAPNGYLLFFSPICCPCRLVDSAMFA